MCVIQAAYAKYECFIRTQNTSDVFDEPIMARAFEDLFHDNLIVRTKDHKSEHHCPFFCLNLETGMSGQLCLQ